MKTWICADCGSEFPRSTEYFRHDGKLWDTRCVACRAAIERRKAPVTKPAATVAPKPEPQFTTDWFSFNVEVWTKVVLPRLPAFDQPLAWLEIGSFEGRSARWVLDTVICDQPNRSLTCIDIWEWAHKAEAVFDENVGTRAIKIKKDASVALLDMIAAGHVFDCVYIDGDHDGRVTLENAVLAWRVLKDDGILIFDDYRFVAKRNWACGKLTPDIGIDAFLAAYKLNLRVLYHNHQVIVQKLPLVR